MALGQEMRTNMRQASIARSLVPVSANKTTFSMSSTESKSSMKLDAMNGPDVLSVKAMGESDSKKENGSFIVLFGNNSKDLYLMAFNLTTPVATKNAVMSNTYGLLPHAKIVLLRLPTIWLLATIAVKSVPNVEASTAHSQTEIGFAGHAGTNSK